MRALKRWLMAGVVAVAAVGLTTAQEPGRQRPGGGGGFGGGITMIAGNAAVQEEVKITDEQKEKLKAASAKVREAMQAKMKDIPREQFREKMPAIMAEVNKDAEKQLAEVLKPEQLRRIKQISVQTQGVRAFGSEEVQTALKLTDEQKGRIKDINETYQKESQELRQGNARPDQSKVNALRKETMEKIDNVLTDDQKKAWKDLTGDPFDTTKLFQGFGGPGGGNRPGGNRPPQNN